jgi:hypothetical protein
MLAPILLQVFVLLASMHALSLVHSVAGIHAVAGVCSVVVRTFTAVQALSLVYAVAGTHAGVFAVAGPTVAYIFASWCCKNMMSCCCLFSLAHAGKVLRENDNTR